MDARLTFFNGVAEAAIPVSLLGLETCLAQALEGRVGNFGEDSGQGQGLARVGGVFRLVRITTADRGDGHRDQGLGPGFAFKTAGNLVSLTGLAGNGRGGEEAEAVPGRRQP